MRAWATPHVVVMILALFPAGLAGQNGQRIARATRTTTPPVIDGRLTDDVWSLASPVTEFSQEQPDEGLAASERTEIRFLYDDQALYVACRMWDSQPSAIVSRLARRDEMPESDWVSLRIDSYNDRQTNYEFTVNPAGVKMDILQFDDGKKEDASWDAVWDVETGVDDEGWTAEFRIPFKALRFLAGPTQEWGLQILRFISRKQEVAHWVLIRRSESGWTSRFGRLTGMENIRPSAHIELLPYGVASERFMPATPAAPEGREFSANAGFNAKYRPEGGLTVDATFNPDFGQVEADPAVLNLTTYETFYPEKRPFFIEGSQIIQFTTFGSAFGPGLFYSRRIGRSLFVQAPPGGYIERQPRFSSILGALKVSGKSPGGFSIGALEAVTQEETATVVDSNGIRSTQVVDPLTNYGLVRLRQDVWSNSNVGMIVTSVNRNGRIPALTAGLDWNLKFLESLYRLDGFLGLSRTTLGGPLQEGSAGKIQFAKDGGPHWRGYVAGDFTSKGYNINDMGFYRRPNDYGLTSQVLYRDDKITDLWRLYNVYAFYHLRLNFDGAELFNAISLSGYVRFRNFWEVTANANVDFGPYDDRETRGNGLYRKPVFRGYTIIVESDRRQPVVASAYAQAGNDDLALTAFAVGGDVEFKPAPNIGVEFGMSHSQRNLERAWVWNLTDLSVGPGITSVFAQRSTHTWDVTARGSFIFTRDLTLQVYTQLFFAKGKYENFLRMTSPSTFVPYAYAWPDFHRLTFNSNVVLRWEYLPGSTMYFVWSQARDGFSGVFDTPWSESFSHTFALPSEQVVLLKVSFWLSY